MTHEMKRKMRGKWQGVLPDLGIDSKYLTKKQGPCPMCYGRDRFSFDDIDGDGTWICRKCGAGDGFALVMQKNNKNFREVIFLIEELLPSVKEVFQPKKVLSEEDRRSKLNKLWLSGSRIDNSCAAGKYLTSRVGFIPDCNDIKGVQKIAYYEMDNPRPTFYPGMIALIRDWLGSPVNIHRTFLTSRGVKAPVSDPKRVMQGDVPKGSAIRLSPPASKIGIAEGIETALSATAIFGTPCWATINSGRMKSWFAPAGVEEVTIFSDNDANFVGQSAAYALAESLHNKGIKVEVMVPDRIGDWNDVLDAKKTIAA
jgi:putative DNA primase/helicase